MLRRQIKRALISVYDKSSIVEFARTLAGEFGIDIISTGATATILKQAGIAVTPVQDVTGFPEMMDGRVKTLHPKIHAAILADRGQPEHVRQLQALGVAPIDIVVVNLYPFSETIAEPDCTLHAAIDMIDIGGPCLLRAAAKNHVHVLVITHPGQYQACLDLLRGEESVDEAAFRVQLAKAAFQRTALYDLEIRRFLHTLPLAANGTGKRTAELALDREGVDVAALRYGENPHQRAHYRGCPTADAGLIRPGSVVSGAELSFNNYVDAVAALELCQELTRELTAPTERGGDDTPPVVVFVKHTNPCGVGIGGDPAEAYRRAYLGDPNAAMGGTLVCNYDVTPELAGAVMETYEELGRAAGVGGFFVEVWVAPHFDDEAVQTIQRGRKWGQRVRLLAVGSMNVASDPEDLESRDIPGGVLEQTRDRNGLNESDWKVVTERHPGSTEMNDLRMAWLICKHTKSNAISICKDGMLLGNGAGQASRVMSCRIATWLARENGHGQRLAGSVAASDAFFPFADGPDILMEAGVTALIQPGGSKRDQETIKACNERGAAMIFTGMRHFKH